MFDTSFDFAKIYNIESACFANLFLQMDATGVTKNAPAPGGEAGVVNAQYENGAKAQFRVTPITTANGTVYNIQSVATPQAYLCIDASSSTGMSPDNPELCGGVVGCRLQAGAWEALTIKHPDDRKDVYTIGSQYFDNVFLRMGNEASQPSPHGGGIVNCRYNHYPWEHFKFVPVS
ncbi:MAG: hypothetical protein ACRYFV_20555 [Janthinobacterium lividum]